MKRLFITSLIVACIGLMASTNATQKVDVGDKAPEFTLKNVDGEMVSLTDYSTRGVILVFTCNHCPYAKAYEDRIIALHNRYKSNFPVVAINPNDPGIVKEDSYKNMQARAEEKGYQFPYLVDETQNVAKAYGALKTPHVYLLHLEKGEYVVRYIGAIDDSAHDESKVTEKYVEEAIKNLDTHTTVATPTTKAIGCSIKWH